MELAGLQVIMDANFESLYSNIDKAYAALGKFTQDVKSMFNSIPDFGKQFKFTSPGGSQASQDAYNTARAKREEAQARYFNARAANAEEKATSSQSKSNKKQIDEYGILVKENNELVRSYYNAATQVLKYGDAAGISAEELERLRLAALKGQEQLKQIEAGAGRFHRNVGNYAGALKPLEFSIAQITREAPAFANSLQTGFLGISNNLAPAVDAFKAFMEEQRKLRAEGKPAQTALQGLSQAFFSWNTAVSAGITLLTIYGPKIIEMMKGTSEATKRKEELKRAEDDWNEAMKTSSSSAAKEIVQLESLYNVATDVTRSNKDRVAAVKELQKEYPSYFKNISQEIIMNGNASSSYYALRDAIIASTQARALQTLIEKKYADNLENLREAENEEISRFDNSFTSQYVKQSEKDLQDLKDQNKDVFKAIKDRNNINPPAIQTYQNNTYKGERALQDNLQRIRKESYDRFLKDNESLYNQLAELQKKSSAYDRDRNATGSGRAKAAKEIQTLADVQKEYNAALDEANRKRDAGLYKEEIEYYNDLAEAYKKVIIESTSKEIKNPLGINSPEIKEYIGLLGDVNRMILTLEESSKKAKAIGEIDKNISEGLLKNNIESKDKLERLTKDIDLYKSAITELTLIDPNGGKLKEFQEILGMMSQDLKLEQSAKSAREFADAVNLIQLKLGAGLITKAGAASEEIKLLNKQLEDALKNGKLINAMVIQIKIDNKEAIREMQETSEAMTKGLEGLVAATISSISTAFGEGLGQIMAGKGSIGDLFGNIISEIGSQIQRYGAFMAQSAATLIAAKRSWELSFSNPYAMLAVSAAVVALGTYLKAQGDKRKGVNFASGGVVYGETFARVGEYSNARGNPEIIAPLDRLKNILQSEGIGGGREMVPYIAETRIKGEDILLTYKRADRRFRR